MVSGSPLNQPCLSGQIQSISTLLIKRGATRWPDVVYIKPPKTRQALQYSLQNPKLNSPEKPFLVHHPPDLDLAQAECQVDLRTDSSVVHSTPLCKQLPPTHDLLRLEKQLSSTFFCYEYILSHVKTHMKTKYALS